MAKAPGKIESSITHDVVVCCEDEKYAKTLAYLNSQGDEDRILIFVETQKGCEQLNSSLHNDKFKTQAIHSGITTKEKHFIFNRFRQRATTILCMTNNATRGFVVEDTSMVINYDFPNDTDSYIRRVEIISRGGKSGKVASWFSPTKDAKLASSVIQFLQKKNQNVDPALQRLGGFLAPIQALPSISNTGEGGFRMPVLNPPAESPLWMKSVPSFSSSLSKPTKILKRPRFCIDEEKNSSGGFIEPNHDNLGHWGSSNNNSNNNGMDTISQQHFEEGGSVAEYLLSEMKKDRQERKTEKEERVKEREERVREREERVKEREERVREREEKGKDREEKAKEREERAEDRKIQREMMIEDRKMQREMMIMLMKKSDVKS